MQEDVTPCHFSGRFRIADLKIANPVLLGAPAHSRLDRAVAMRDAGSPHVDPRLRQRATKSCASSW